MKKLLIATTALVATVGMAAADNKGAVITPDATIMAHGQTLLPVKDIMMFTKEAAVDAGPLHLMATDFGTALKSHYEVAADETGALYGTTFLARGDDLHLTAGGEMLMTSVEPMGAKTTAGIVAI